MADARTTSGPTDNGVDSSADNRAGSSADNRAGARAHSPLTRLFRRFNVYWKRLVVRSVDHAAVVRRLDDDAMWSARYAFMLMMSAGIAMLGMLLSSPAVVIGAMLISPLMGPLMALGFSLAVFDFLEARRALVTIAGGIFLAIAFCALIVFMSPLQAVTPEILSRTRPNFFDLLVAVFSALAGAYAVIRGRGETIVGVAIATALMPPLAAVGFGLATFNSTVFFGALGLFMTNLLAIALSAAVMAKIYGFGTDFAHHTTRLQALGIIAIFALLSIPLALSLRQIAWEAVTSRQTREIVVAYFGSDARVSQLEMDYAAEPIVARATVQSTRRRFDADAQISERLSSALSTPVRAQISQLLVDSDATLREREQREIDAARKAQGRASKANAEEARIVAGELAILGAGSSEDVVIDPVSRRASLNAEAIAGVRLPAWRELERRVAARHPGWAIVVVPPLATLPLVPFDPEISTPSIDGAEAIADAVWALQRWGVTRASVTGRAAGDEGETDDDRAALATARSKAVADALTAAGVTISSSASATADALPNAEGEYGRVALRSALISADSLTRTATPAR